MVSICHVQAEIPWVVSVSGVLIISLLRRPASDAAMTHVWLRYAQPHLEYMAEACFLEKSRFHPFLLLVDLTHSHL